MPKKGAIAAVRSVVSRSVWRSTLRGRISENGTAAQCTSGKPASCSRIWRWQCCSLAWSMPASLSKRSTVSWPWRCNQARTACSHFAASALAWARGTIATKRFGSAAANSGLASVAPCAHSQSANQSAGRPHSSRSHKSTCGTPRSRGNKMASGPSAWHSGFMASQARRASKCEPAHRSEVERAASIKLCTGPSARVSKAASPLGSAANAPAKAEVRSRWSQMLWSGTRVSAGSSGQSVPSMPLSSSSRRLGPKRQKASKLRVQSISLRWLSWCSTSAAKCSKLRDLMSSISVSPRLPRSNSAPVSGWISTGRLVQRTCAQSAIFSVRAWPVLV